MALTRRNLLKSTGAAGAALLTAPGALKGFDQFFRPASALSATATKVTTCCGVCSPACGLQAAGEGLHGRRRHQRIPDGDHAGGKPCSPLGQKLD